MVADVRASDTLRSLIGETQFFENKLVVSGMFSLSAQKAKAKNGQEAWSQCNEL